MTPTLTIPSPVLAGRAKELARLCQLLDVARSGIGQFALLLGEAGVGKSRMCRELQAAAMLSGALWVTGRLP